MKKKKTDKEEKRDNNTGNGIDNKDNRNHYNENINVSDGSSVNADPENDSKNGYQKAESGGTNGTDKDVRQGSSSEEKLAEMQDRYLRLSAEFDNYRKRTLREKMELTKHAGENILAGIIPVLDDFERALKLMENVPQQDAVKSGIELIYSKFSEFLKQNGLKEIDALNQDFNVDLHEAITKVPVQDQAMKGKVVEVVVKGYWLHDKVMRFSKVVVGE